MVISLFVQSYSFTKNVRYINYCELLVTYLEFHFHPQFEVHLK